MNNTIAIKVCGIKNNHEVKQMRACKVDIIGLNFIKTSKRYFEETEYEKHHDKTKIAGIFQNHNLEEVKNLLAKYDLDMLQFHGQESNTFLSHFKHAYKIIKVINVANEEDVALADNYTYADYILFDSVSKKGGGSGHAFDWSILKEYKSEKPFFIAGGINPSDAKKILSINHPMFYGVDINSGFELSPGVKDIDVINRFVDLLSIET